MCKPLTFQTPEQMLDHLIAGNDLYNVKTGEYAFHYNENDAICVYHLDDDHAKELALAAAASDIKWSEMLGTHGSAIYDAPENQHWCIDSYASDFWIDVEDLLTYRKEHGYVS